MGPKGKLTVSRSCPKQNLVATRKGAKKKAALSRSFPKQKLVAARQASNREPCSEQELSLEEGSSYQGGSQGVACTE